MEQHPSDEILKRFANGKASREEGRAVVAHLLKRCPPCATKIKAFLEPRPVAGGSHEAVLKRFEEGVREKLEELAEELPSRPVGPRELSSPGPPPKGKGRDR